MLGRLRKLLRPALHEEDRVAGPLVLQVALIAGSVMPTIGNFEALATFGVDTVSDPC